MTDEEIISELKSLCMKSNVPLTYPEEGVANMTIKLTRQDEKENVIKILRSSEIYKPTMEQIIDRIKSKGD